MTGIGLDESSILSGSTENHPDRDGFCFNEPSFIAYIDKLLLSVPTYIAMDHRTLLELLSKVNSIKTKYDELDKPTVANFNIFKILKIERKEVGTHTPLLRELLSPKGSHGMGSAFLEIFLDVLQIEEFTLTNCTVQNKDTFAGFVSAEFDSGGLIDIVIESENGKAIIIENKIYAGDQKKQLSRYHNHGIKRYGEGNFKLFYLTLFGTAPSEFSRYELDDASFQILSFEYHILHWLQRCQTELSMPSHIREIISQYIDLLKHLTNQTINHLMANEIAQLIVSKSEYIKAANEIEKNWKVVEDLLVAQFKDHLVSEIIPELKQSHLTLRWEISEPNFGKPGTGFYFWLEEWKVLNIAFGFEFVNDKYIEYGFRKLLINKLFSKDLDLDKLRAAFSALDQRTEHWPCYAKYRGWNEIHWTEVPELLSNGHIQKCFIETISRAIDLFNRTILNAKDK